MDWHDALTGIPPIVATVLVSAILGWIGWMLRTAARWVALAMARPVAGGIAYDWICDHPDDPPASRREDAIAKGEDYLRIAVPFRMETDRLRAEVLGGLGVLLATDPSVTIAVSREAPAPVVNVTVTTPSPPAPSPPPAPWWERWLSALRPVPPPESYLPPRLEPAAAIAMGQAARAQDTMASAVLSERPAAPSTSP